jgi:hypothetical protein
MNSTSFWTQLQHKAVIRGYCIKDFIKQYKYIIKNFYLKTLFIIYTVKVKNNQLQGFKVWTFITFPTEYIGLHGSCVVQKFLSTTIYVPKYTR